MSCINQWKWSGVSVNRTFYLVKLNTQMFTAERSSILLTACTYAMVKLHSVFRPENAHNSSIYLYPQRTEEASFDFLLMTSHSSCPTWTLWRDNNDTMECLSDIKEEPYYERPNMKLSICQNDTTASCLQHVHSLADGIVWNRQPTEKVLKMAIARKLHIKR